VILALVAFFTTYFCCSMTAAVAQQHNLGFSSKTLVQHAAELHEENARIDVSSSPERPSYDHQNTTYKARFHPLQLKNTKISLNPFFAPDHSMEQMMQVIQKAKESIDISIPSFASWIRCSYPQKDKKCIGCSAQHLIEKESFSVFQALHNALHRGIKVRILTNDFNDKLCEDSMDLLAYLQVAGATVSYFNQLSFTHSKYIAIDRKTVIVSSINFSRTSIMSNREAGIIIENSPQVVAYTQSVFEWDLTHGYVKDLPKYPQADLDLIKNTKHIDVVIPPPYDFKYCNASSPKPAAIVGIADVSIIVSPDYAFDAIAEFQKASTSFYLSVYQITESQLVDALIDMKKKNPNLDMKIFVSREIYGEDDQALALQCYNKLYENGIIVRLSHKYCMFYSHQKYWVVDQRVVFMSTGNWSPTDYPLPPYVFPAFGDPEWRKTNRDFTVRIENSPHTLQRFMDLFVQDYEQGSHYVPS